MSDIKTKIENSDTFYEVLDFLVDINDCWIEDYQLETLKRKHLFKELMYLKGYDALQVLRPLLKMIDRINQDKGAGKKNVSPSKKKKRALEKMDNFKKFMHSMYGEWNGGIATNAPDHAHKHFESLLLMEESINVENSFENNTLAKPYKKQVTTKEFKDFFKTVEVTFAIKITPYNVTQIWRGL